MEADEFTRLVDEVCAARRARGARDAQRQLADQLGCHPRTIGRYKDGARSIRSDVADRLRRIWHAEVDGPEYVRQMDEQRKKAGDY